MNAAQRAVLIVSMISVCHSSALADSAHPPVDSDATPEARALLDYFYSISGRYLLSGQHNYPNTRDRNSQFAARHMGKTPVVFSTDWGHADRESTDSYLARPDIVEESIRQHRRGAIVTICWHAVPPTADEPVTFRPRRDADPDHLASVQGQLTDGQFRDLLTEGTELRARWEGQVDQIAKYLKQLQEANVPILWRPYHEMNGDWFWWGGRAGEHSTADLYRQLYDRLVHHHGLHNLVWVWSVDRMPRAGMEHEKYFPGAEYVDILSLDVYGNDFAQSYYDSLCRLSDGKPLVLGEVGNPPALEVLDKQPRWACYVVWAGMAANTPKETYEELLDDPRLLGLEDPEYAESASAYWESCGLSPDERRVATPNYSGMWVLDEERSAFDGRRRWFRWPKLEVVHSGDSLTIVRSRVTEWGDRSRVESELTLDGAEHHAERYNTPVVTTATRGEDGGSITISTTFDLGDRARTSSESWTLQENGDLLQIEQVSESPRGRQESTLVYRRWL